MADIVLTNPRFEISLLGPRGVEPTEVARPAKSRVSFGVSLNFLKPATERARSFWIIKVSRQKTMPVSISLA